MNKHIGILVLAGLAGCTARGGVDGGADRPARVVLVIAEPEYETSHTLPLFAARMLHAPLGHEITVVGEDPVDPRRLSQLPEALGGADVVILSVRRRALHADEMAAFKEYLSRGGPLVAIRTSNHAFAPRGDVAEGSIAWPTFDQEVLGGNYHGHHGAGPIATITAAPGAVAHPVLRDVAVPFQSRGSLYQVSPLRSDIEPLLVGRIDGQPPEPVAWTTKHGRSRIFYTSLGHKDDFADPSFVRMLRNAVQWALDRAVQ